MRGLLTLAMLLACQVPMAEARPEDYEPDDDDGADPPRADRTRTLRVRDRTDDGIRILPIDQFYRSIAPDFGNAVVGAGRPLPGDMTPDEQLEAGLERQRKAAGKRARKAARRRQA